MLRKIPGLLFHPITLTIITGTIILCFIPPINKYKIKEVDYFVENLNSVTTYHDFNNDGNSEEISFLNLHEPDPSVLIRTLGMNIDQWRFSGKPLSGKFFYFDDYNNDGNNEFFWLICRNDSVFFNAIDPFSNNKFFIKDLYLDQTDTSIEVIDTQVRKCGSFDINDDGYKELFILLSSGFSMIPRRIYAIDLYKKEIIKSPLTGQNMLNPKMYDINQDSIPEILVNSYACGNWKKDILFSDNFAWLTVFTDSLNFLFPPIKNDTFQTVLQVVPFKPGETPYLLVLKKFLGTDSIDNELMLYSSSGQLIRSRIIGPIQRIENAWFITHYDQECMKAYLVHANGDILEYDSNLNVHDSILIEGLSEGKLEGRFDLDNDGLDEFIFWGKNRQELVIVRNDFSHPVYAKIINNFQNDIIHALKYEQGNSPKYYYRCGRDAFLFEYIVSPWYPVRFLVYPGIYIIIYLILLLIFKTQQARARRRYNTIRKINELQLKTIKSQLDPHFTLNLIDSIGALFYKKDSEKASYVFGKYARLLRTTIINSDNIETTLENEIEYVMNYLDLEKFRYSNKFDYNVSLHDDVNPKANIPKMLIHTIVENAVKHGIKHKKENDGVINISAEKKPGLLIIKIADNGVGRQKAAEYALHSTGKGMQIIDEIANLYFELKKVKISYQIKDLFDKENNPVGTHVKVFVKN